MEKKAVISFNLPDEERDFIIADNANAIYAALNNLKLKVAFNSEKTGIPEPKKMVFREVFNMIEDEIQANKITKLFS